MLVGKDLSCREPHHILWVSKKIIPMFWSWCNAFNTNVAVKNRAWGRVIVLASLKTLLFFPLSGLFVWFGVGWRDWLLETSTFSWFQADIVSLRTFEFNPVIYFLKFFARDFLSQNFVWRSPIFMRLFRAIYVLSNEAIKTPGRMLYSRLETRELTLLFSAVYLWPDNILKMIVYFESGNLFPRNTLC